MKTTCVVVALTVEGPGYEPAARQSMLSTRRVAGVDGRCAAGPNREVQCRAVVGQFWPVLGSSQDQRRTSRRWTACCRTRRRPAHRRRPPRPGRRRPRRTTTRWLVLRHAEPRWIDDCDVIPDDDLVDGRTFVRRTMDRSRRTLQFLRPPFWNVPGPHASGCPCLRETDGIAVRAWSRGRRLMRGTTSARAIERSRQGALRPRPARPAGASVEETVKEPVPDAARHVR